MRIFSIISLFFVVLVVTPAFATPQMAKQPSAERFASMDADSNGVVNKEEFLKALPNMQEAAFDGIDTNKDGGITLDEWEAFNQGHGSSMPSQHQQDAPNKSDVPKHDMMMPERSKK